MSSLVGIPTSHSRLLYTCRSIRDLSLWQSALAQVESEIEQAWQMEEANSFIYLYFFAPSEEFVAEEEYRVGREIVGMRRGKKSDDVALWDRDGCHCYRAMGGGFPMDWNIIFARERECRLARQNRLASIWRICFDSEEPEQIFLEFFEKK